MARPMRVLLATLLALSLATSLPAGAQDEFSPSSLVLTVFADGAVGVEYVLDVDITTPRISVPLFGVIYENLIILDGDANPLDFTLFQGGLSIDTLGADSVDLSYETFDLTNKTGRVWTLSADIPIDSLITLPETATIISVNNLPLAISSVGDSTVMTMPAGNLIVSYSLGVLGTQAHALALISEAEDTIAKIADKGVILTAAGDLLKEAETALESEDFARAEELASNAVILAMQIDELALEARSSIDEAQSALAQALEEGRTINLGEAQQLIAGAQDRYFSGDYSSSKDLANQAMQAALSAVSPTTPTVSPVPSPTPGLPSLGGLLDNITILVVAIAVVIIAILAVVFTVRRRKRKSVSSVPELVQKQWRDTDLARILDDNPELRLEDQEVVRFIAESGGEVFEAEIREKFQLPKTTVWRMVKRLADQEIVETVNLRGNNLTRILPKYELQKESG